MINCLYSDALEPIKDAKVDADKITMILTKQELQNLNNPTFYPPAELLERCNTLIRKYRDRIEFYDQIRAELNEMPVKELRVGYLAYKKMQTGIKVVVVRQIKGIKAVCDPLFAYNQEWEITGIAIKTETYNIGKLLGSNVRREK